MAAVRMPFTFNLDSGMSASMQLLSQKSHGSPCFDAWSPGRLLVPKGQAHHHAGGASVESFKRGWGGLSRLSGAETPQHLLKCLNSSAAHASEGEQTAAEGASIRDRSTWDSVSAKLEKDDCFTPADLLYLEYTEILVKELENNGHSVNKHLAPPERTPMESLWLKTKGQNQ